MPPRQATLKQQVKTHFAGNKTIMQFDHCDVVPSPDSCLKPFFCCFIKTFQRLSSCWLQARVIILCQRTNKGPGSHSRSDFLQGRRKRDLSLARMWSVNVVELNTCNWVHFTLPPLYPYFTSVNTCCSRSRPILRRLHPLLIHWRGTWNVNVSRKQRPHAPGYDFRQFALKRIVSLRPRKHKISSCSSLVNRS
jgi:hypothetical protein